MRHLVALAIVALGFAFPGSAKEMHPKAPHNQSEIQDTSTKPKSPAQSPIVVNIAAPEKPAHEKEQDAKDRAEKAETDRKLVEFTGQLAYYTFGLFAATIALVIATCVMAYLGFRQARDMKESLVIAKRLTENVVE